jgi:predicted transcriptional regulator
MDKTTIYLPPELHASLKEISRRTGRPQAALIREAVEAYVVESQQDRPWPQSIGLVSVDTTPAIELEEWLEENWLRE